jgi:hypothetical protein
LFVDLDRSQSVAAFMTPPPAGKETAVHSNDHPDDSERPSRPQTWRERHAVTILTVVLFSLLALVITVQVAC